MKKKKTKMHEEIVHLLQELGEKKINTQWTWINKIKMGKHN